MTSRTESDGRSRYAPSMESKSGSRRGGRRPKIDWVAAKTLYLELGPERTYGQVAARFPVSARAVGQHAAKNGWAAAATEFDQRVALEAARKIARSRAAQIAQTARLRDAAADELERRFTVTEIAEAMEEAVLIRLFEVAEKNVRLDAGEATELVSMAEAQQLFSRLIGLVAPFVPKDRRAEFRERLGAFGNLETAVGQ